ncbi:MAG: hypothetical protein DBX36_00575 [Oscillospiraceae bacterium]|nr:MAG: hypothetical protein DBX36_00575 [Oscillospiraceae bacterium]
MKIMCANENTILYGYKIIRNCCIATMLCVTLVSCNDAEKTVFNDDVTTETDANDISVYESDTGDLSLPEFSISDEGVLTAYNGTEYNISIPDNVSAISEDAFGASPVAGEIKTIKLGKSVESIDTQAFVSLTALESIEVPEENTNYKFLDGVLFKNDNTLFFCMPNIIKDNYDMFDVFFDIISDKIEGEGESNLVSGGMVAEIEREFADLEDPFNRKYYISCNSFTANGQTMEVDKSIIREYKGLNYFKSYYAYVTNQCVVYSNRTDCGFGNTWLFTDNEIIRVEVINAEENREKINGEEWYNNSVIIFMRGEDGSLNYIRKPRKYIAVGGTYDCDIYWTGLNEFVKEEGTVEIENGKIVYKSEKSWTAIEAGYDKYINTMFNENNNGFSTVEEYLAHNAEVYESAK